MKKSHALSYYEGIYMEFNSWEKWAERNCSSYLQCEFTAHNVCKDEELNLIAATTNYNFQTTNSLTERTGVRLSHR